MSPYMNLWYSGAAPIRFRLTNGDIRIIYSSQGTIQGSPLGGLCFCYGFDVVLKRVSRRLSDKVMIMTDMDDLSVFCPISEAVLVCQVVREELAREGLHLQESKNCAYTTPTNYGALQHAFNSDESLMVISSDGAVVGKLSEGGVKLLGVPFGSDQFVAHFLEQRLQRVEGLMQLLPKLENMQVANLLLRSCINQMNVFLNRALPPSQSKADFNARLDESVQRCFRRIFNLPESEDIYTGY